MTTPDRRILPAAQAILVDRAGRATPPFYDLLRRIVDATSLTPELVAEVRQILEQIENLPTDGFMPITSRVVGQDSIEWQGLLANGLTTLSLQGDTSDQRSTWYYGTNSSNEKGWHRLYNALDTGAGILKRNSGYVEIGEVDDPSDLPVSGNVGEAYWVRGEGDIEERGLWVWDGDASEWVLDTEASGIVGFEIAEDDYGDITVSDEGATWTIDNNVVTNEKLRDSAALSVIGRASNTGGDPADIAASADKAVLHRDGNALAFTPIDSSYISDFDEAAQDAVGGILANSADIEFTYDDGNDEITAVLSAAVHSSLALADTAVQPGDLAAVAFSGDYGDLSNTPSIPSAANPSASVGLSAVNGSADTFMRSDAAPALDQGIDPTWTGEHIFTLPTTFIDDVLIAGDNVELQIGEEADLRLYHDGTNSVIRNGSGALSIVGVTGDVAPVHLPSTVDVLLTGTAFGHYRSGTNNGAILHVGLYRGSFAAPTSPVVGTGLGFINFTAHDGATDLRTAAQFAAVASEEWIPGVAHGANWRVQTVAAGSTAIQNRMLVGANAIGGFVQGPDGVAAQPGWSFLDDPDTGIFRPDTNELGIAAGGALVMRIDSRGVVWIRDGITAPGASITGMAGLYIDSADGDLKIRFADGTVKTIVTDT